MARLATTFAVICFFLAGCSGPSATTAEPPTDIVAVIDGDRIALSELMEEYHRAATMAEEAADDTVEAYVDFLERYVNYRLKVLEAEAAGIDEDPDVTSEIDGYRRQYARPYLLDQVVLVPLMRTLHARKQETVDISHILLSIPGNASPADTLALYERIAAIRDSARTGADFGELARRHSTDPSANADPSGVGYAGHLGYISGGVTVRPFEDAAYSTSVGGISDIVRTRFGYHIVKVHDRRTTPGDLRLSHIMITPAARSAADTADAMARLDSVVTRLESGADFGAVASVFSDDRQSAERGGDLGFVSFSGRFPTAMKEAAYGLPGVGSISEPVETPYGFHVITVTDERQVPTFDESYEQLKQEAGRLPEARARETEYADSVLAARSASIDTSLITDRLRGYSPDSLASLGSLPAEWHTTAVAAIGDSTFTLASFVDETVWNRFTPARDLSHEQMVRTAAETFMHERAIDYEMELLAQHDPEFRRTLSEFRNGILLFSLMEDSVWTAAAEDSAALHAVYDENPEAYRFPDRDIIASVYARSRELVSSATSLLAAGLDVETVTDSLGADGALNVDTTYVSGRSNSIYDRVSDADLGAFTAPIAYNNGFIALKQTGVEPSRLKTFEEARAELLSELQTRLEDQLVRRLRAKYEARTFPDRLRSLLASADSSTMAG